MRAFTVVSALIAVAVSGVVATPGDAVATLFARQDTAMPEIPPECQKSCATSQKITACGTDLACMCTNEMGQGIVDCGNCGINYHKNDPNINTYKQQFQTAVNAFSESCTQAGHPIGPFTVVGSSNSGSNGGSKTSASGSTPTGSSSNSNSSNGAMTFQAAAGTSALAAVAVVMVSVF